MTALAIRRFFSDLRARYHVWHGQRAYQAGRLQAAGRHLSRALSSGHSSFTAYLLLGKVAYRIRDMPRAMDCFRMAERTDPSRYALEGFPKGFIESLGSHVTAAPRQKYHIVIEPSPIRSSSKRTQRPLQDVMNGGSRRASPETKHALGDFGSRAEQEEARSRPMFSAGEWADIDWDLEARKLFGD